MQLLRDSHHRSMPWANGGGTTYQVALWPPGSGLADFDWRISMADIADDGPFSALPGIDRILVLLDGGPMRLDIDDDSRVIQRGDVVRFTGEAAVTASLEAGPTRDLNVMTRRAKCAASVAIQDEPRATLAPAPGETVLATPLTGAWHAATPDVVLGPRDFLVIDETVDVRGHGSLIVVRIADS